MESIVCVVTLDSACIGFLLDRIELGVSISRCPVSPSPVVDRRSLFGNLLVKQSSKRVVLVRTKLAALIDLSKFVQQRICVTCLLRERAGCVLLRDLRQTSESVAFAF